MYKHELILNCVLIRLMVLSHLHDLGKRSDSDQLKNIFCQIVVDRGKIRIYFIFGLCVSDLNAIPGRSQSRPRAFRAISGRSRAIPGRSQGVQGDLRTVPGRSGRSRSIQVDLRIFLAAPSSVSNYLLSMEDAVRARLELFCQCIIFLLTSQFNTH